MPIKLSVKRTLLRELRSSHLWVMNSCALVLLVKHTVNAKEMIRKYFIFPP
jgi:hypothetical protein